MNVEDVKNVVRKSLGLEGDVEIDDDVQLENYGVGRVEFADVFFQMGVYDMGDFSDGGISEKGRTTLRHAGIFSGNYSCLCRFCLMSFLPSSEIFGSLTSADVYYIINYKQHGLCVVA